MDNLPNCNEKIFTDNVEQLSRLARHNVNILRVTPEPISESNQGGGVFVDFEYLYKTADGQTKWHKGSIYWHDYYTALDYTLKVATELQHRLGQAEER